MKKMYLGHEWQAQKAYVERCYPPIRSPLTSGTLQQTPLPLETAESTSPEKKKIFQWEYGQSAIARWVKWHVTTTESTVRQVDLTLPHFSLEVAVRTLDKERKRMIPCDLQCLCASWRDRRVRQEQADIALRRRRFKRAFFPSHFGFFFSLGKTRKRAQKSFKNFKNFSKFLLNYMLA